MVEHVRDLATLPKCRAQFELSDQELANVAETSIQASGAPLELKASATQQVAQWLTDRPGRDH